MKALIFNGAPEQKPNSTSNLIANYLAAQLRKHSIDSTVFNMIDADIPMLDFSLQETPQSILDMNASFQEADFHIWLSPLYHGSIPGMMKNCLDWMELTSKNPTPYLTDKIVGMVCWADGAQAMQGINTMDAIAKALRAWTLPFGIPIVRKNLFEENHPTQITPAYHAKFDLMAELISNKEIAAVSKKLMQEAVFLQE